MDRRGKGVNGGGRAAPGGRRPRLLNLSFGHVTRAAGQSRDPLDSPANGFDRIWMSLRQSASQWVVAPFFFLTELPGLHQVSL